MIHNRVGFRSDFDDRSFKNTVPIFPVNVAVSYHVDRAISLYSVGLLSVGADALANCIVQVIVPLV